MCDEPAGGTSPALDNGVVAVSVDCADGSALVPVKWTNEWVVAPGTKYMYPENFNGSIALMYHLMVWDTTTPVCHVTENKMPCNTAVCKIVDAYRSLLVGKYPWVENMNVPPGLHLGVTGAKIGRIGELGGRSVVEVECDGMDSSAASTVLFIEGGCPIDVRMPSDHGPLYAKIVEGLKVDEMKYMTRAKDGMMRCIEAKVA